MANLIYCPRLSNGKEVSLNWPLKIYRWTNNVCWPIENNAPWWFKTFDRFLWILAFVVFCIHNDAEFRYLRVNFHNLDDFLTGVPTYLVLIEIHIRGFTLGLQKEKYKKLLQRFFAEVYIDKSIHPKQYQKIQHQMWPVYVVFIFFMFTIVSYCATPPINLLVTGKRELIYKMIPILPYKDYFYLYLLLLLSNIWVAFIVGTMIFGEANVLATLIFHLNGRYIFMRKNFINKIEQLLKSDSQTDVVANCRRIVVETLQENLKLNKFAEDIQNEFSFRIFIAFAFSATSLCALGFKVYTSPMTSIAYIFWTVGKIQEIIAWGAVGTTIETTTNGISSMYYESNWESVVERSSDSKENVRLMKLINLSMTTNRKPFNLTGLNFFNVSLISVLTILQGAFSYFTCLIAIR